MKLLYSFLFGLVYTFIYVLLAIGLAGGGHGIFIFLAPLFTWILLFPAFFLLTRLDKGFLYRVFFVVIMLTHYALTLIFLKPLFSFDSDPAAMKIWKYYPGYIIFTVAWYLSGQIIMWTLFFLSSKNQRVIK